MPSFDQKKFIAEHYKGGVTTRDVIREGLALVQCRLYASELVDGIPTVREVFAFSVVEIDDEFYKDMKRTGFKDIFSLSERVVYGDFVIGSKDDIPLHLYVMPASSLITDAKARNRVFEEVLRFNMEKSVPSVDAADVVPDPAMAR